MLSLASLRPLSLRCICAALSLLKTDWTSALTYQAFVKLTNKWANPHWVLKMLVVSNSATLWTVACQAALSMGFSRQETGVGALFSSRGSYWRRDWTLVPHSAGRFCTIWATREATESWLAIKRSSTDNSNQMGLAGSSEGKTLQCRGHGFDDWSGNWGTTAAWCSQKRQEWGWISGMLSKRSQIARHRRAGTVYGCTYVKLESRASRWMVTWD